MRIAQHTHTQKNASLFGSQIRTLVYTIIALHGAHIPCTSVGHRVAMATTSERMFVRTFRHWTSAHTRCACECASGYALFFSLSLSLCVATGFTGFGRTEVHTHMKRAGARARVLQLFTLRAFGGLDFCLCTRSKTATLASGGGCVGVRHRWRRQQQRFYEVHSCTNCVSTSARFAAREHAG